MDSLRQSRKIKLIVTRHEQAAAMMAATVGRLTGASQKNIGNMNRQAQALPPHALSWVGNQPLCPCRELPGLQSSQGWLFTNLGLVATL